MIYIFLTIFTFEVAYKKDSGKIAIYGIEQMAMAVYILLIERVSDYFKFDFQTFIVASSFIFPIYYIIKCIIVDTKDKKKKLDELSDIKNIIKEEKPSKKLAKKRKV